MNISFKLSALHIILFATFIFTSPICLSGAQANQIGERVMYFQADGTTVSDFYSVRTTNPELNYLFRDKSELDSYVDSLLYRFPDGGEKFKRGVEQFWTTQGGDLSHLRRMNLEGEPAYHFERLDAGINRWKNWNGKTKIQNEYFGDFIGGSFDQYAAAFVIPLNMEFVSYSANVPGKWIERKDTLSFFANDVNNVVFDLTYRLKLTGLYNETQSSLEDLPVDLSLEIDGLKITLIGAVLFDSGSSALTSDGSNILSRIAENLAAKEGIRIVVAGHTDNDPINTERFPSNWHLSSARSLSVLEKLSEFGVAEKFMEARAFGEQHPTVPNSSEENKSLNRRIEILVIDEN